MDELDRNVHEFVILPLCERLLVFRSNSLIIIQERLGLVLSKKTPILYSEENLCFKAKIIEYPE